jgi:hypothetical protein
VTEYDKLLNEARAKTEAFSKLTAKEYIPKTYYALRDENTNLTPEDARDRIEKDCADIWSKRTILDALPDEAKDLEKQKAGRLSQKEANSARDDYKNMDGSISYGKRIPEMLVEGHEREYLTWFYRHACNPAAITKEDIDEYVSHYSTPCGMRAGFEYYRALFDDVKQNKEYSKVKLPMPVLAPGGECSFGTAALDSMRLLATDVRGGVVADSGHWIAEERPDFLIDQLFKFFGNTTR